MSGKKIVGFGLIIILLGAVGLAETLAQPSKGGSAYSVDPERSALMLRKGKELFGRARYNEAKELFRKAVQADPDSQKAWSYYDLAQLYSVAEQFKNHGHIVLSSAPEQIPEPAQPPSPGVTPPPPAAKEKVKTIPPKKEKTAKEKGPIPSEAPKGEPAKPEAPKPAPAPIPTPAPGGMKILKDEGC